jgi:transcriptional regulator with XRE-family HTH domain
MTLGDCVKEYRDSHDLSQRQFAELCDLSNAYISVLEKNVNPKTGEAPAPTYGVYKKIAGAMGISVQSLMEKADESAVSLGSNILVEMQSEPFSKETKQIIDRRLEDADANKRELVSLYKAMTDADKEKLLDFARFIVDSYRRTDKRRK